MTPVMLWALKLRAYLCSVNSFDYSFKLLKLYIKTHISLHLIDVFKKTVANSLKNTNKNLSSQKISWAVLLKFVTFYQKFNNMY